MNKTTILVSIILSVALVSYGYINISHKNKVWEAEQAETRRIRVEKTIQEEKLGACLNKTEALYSQWWKNACKSRGLPESCNLPAGQVEMFDKERGNFRETCFKRYPR